MAIKVERLAGESIINVVISRPSNPEQDMPSMFGEIIQLRRTIQGDVVMIIDVRDVVSSPDAFNKIVLSLAEASRGVKVSQTSGLASPPITVFIGSGPLAALLSQSMVQEQYGGVKGHLCTSYEEALALARAKLSKTETKTE